MIQRLSWIDRAPMASCSSLPLVYEEKLLQEEAVVLEGYGVVVLRLAFGLRFAIAVGTRLYTIPFGPARFRGIYMESPAVGVPTRICGAHVQETGPLDTPGGYPRRGEAPRFPAALALLPCRRDC